jgi:hypothetical protein
VQAHPKKLKAKTFDDRYKNENFILSFGELSCYFFRKDQSFYSKPTPFDMFSATANMTVLTAVYTYTVLSQVF